MARLVAKKLVLYHRRAGGQSQHSVLLDMDAKPDRIQSVLTYAKRNLRASLSVEQLARVAHLSPRQFSRAFHAATGRSPAKAIESLRVETARVMLEQRRDSITTSPARVVSRVATTCGAHSSEPAGSLPRRCAGKPASETLLLGWATWTVCAVLQSFIAVSCPKQPESEPCCSSCADTPAPPLL